jgi:hypothetical protein
VKTNDEQNNCFIPQILSKLERRNNSDRLEHKVNQLGSKLDIIIEHLTSIKDLPEE